MESSFEAVIASYPLSALALQVVSKHLGVANKDEFSAGLYKHARDNYLGGKSLYQCFLYRVKDKYLALVSLPSCDVQTVSGYYFFKAACDLIRSHNQRLRSGAPVLTIGLLPEALSFTVHERTARDMALAYSELFTSSTTVRQKLFGVYVQTS